VRESGESPKAQDAYSRMAHLPRNAWAWEYLRRNPHYLTAYMKRDTAFLAQWPLQRFEDPDIDARDANVFWCPDACRYVLPLTASLRCAQEDGHDFSLNGLQCRVTIHREDDRWHILFAQDGRALQLEISGTDNLDNCALFTAVLPPPRLRTARLLALRRLSDLMTHRCLRPALYPPERRSARLIHVLRALDLSLARAPHRDIAIALFGRERVERDWHHAHNHLRDHVRRAITAGRELMEGGYRKFLR